MPARTVSYRSGPAYDKKFFCPDGTGTHRKSVCVQSCTTVSISGAGAPCSPTFLLFQKRMESRQRKKMPPHHSGLKILPVTTLRRARSLCSLKQALRLTSPAKFSPFGHRPPFKGAGSCTNTFLVSCMRCELHFQCGRFTYTGAGPYRDDYLSLHARRRSVPPCGGSPAKNVRKKENPKGFSFCGTPILFRIRIRS